MVDIEITYQTGETFGGNMNIKQLIKRKKMRNYSGG
jgi:hypothetical protein